MMDPYLIITPVFLFHFYSISVFGVTLHWSITATFIIFPDTATITSHCDVFPTYICDFICPISYTPLHALDSKSPNSDGKLHMQYALCKASHAILHVPLSKSSSECVSLHSSFSWYHSLCASFYAHFYMNGPTYANCFALLRASTFAALCP